MKIYFKNEIKTKTDKIILVIVAVTVVVVLVLALTGHLGPVTSEPGSGTP
jgi:hypothetical protein